MSELKEVKVRLKLDNGISLLSDQSIDTPERAIALLGNEIRDFDREVLSVINLDTKNRPINFNNVAVGGVNSVNVDIPNIFKTAIASNAAKVIVLHNHPSGDVHPSQEDREMTGRIVEAANMLNIPVLDHIIVGAGNDHFYSFMANHFLTSATNSQPRDKSSLNDEEVKYTAAENILSEKDSEENSQESHKKKAEQYKKEHRNRLNEQFIQSMDPDHPTKSMQWLINLVLKRKPYNLDSGKDYFGDNMVLLAMAAVNKGYNDPRWLSFKDVRKIKGAFVKPGEKSTKIMIPNIWLLPAKEDEKPRKVTSAEYKRTLKDHPEMAERFSFSYFSAPLFNAQQCTGLPDYDPKQRKKDEYHYKYVSDALKKLGIRVKNDISDHCCYDEKNRTLQIPDRSVFNCSYEYSYSILHELSYIVGDANHLNRKMDLGNRDWNKAYNALISELACAFIASDLTIEDADTVQLDLKAKAFNQDDLVRQWRDIVTNHPDALINAIYKADETVSFLDLCAGKITLDQYYSRSKGKKNVSYDSSIDQFVFDQEVVTPVATENEVTDRKAKDAMALAERIAQLGHDFDPYDDDDNADIAESVVSSINTDLLNDNTEKWRDKLIEIFNDDVDHAVTVQAYSILRDLELFETRYANRADIPVSVKM